jgi:FKBP-type peptidyl-prolyl cis-trans isomerase
MALSVKGVQSGSPATPSTLSAADQKARENTYLQMYGQIVVHNTGVLELGLDSQQKEQFVLGMKAALDGEKLPEFNQGDMEGAQQFFERKRESHIAEIKKLGEAFLAEKQKEPGVQKTASGLLYKIITQGDNVRANSDSAVNVSYEVRSIDGTVLENTQGKEESLYLGMLQPGFIEAIKLVGQGGEAIAYIPSDLAYGDGSALVFSFKTSKITQPTLGNEDLNGKEEPKVNTKTPSK